MRKNGRARVAPGARAWAVTCLVLAACGGGRDATPGGLSTVIVGMNSDVAGFNTVTYTDQYTGELIDNALFTPLVRYDENLQVKPHLAESWDLTGDTGVVMRLRRDVKWQDGPPVTAEDVKFTFDMAKDPSSASLMGSSFLGNVDRAEVVDSFTIRFHFARPHGQAMEDFAWSPMPKHLLGNVAAAELKNAPFNRQPVGSGPFKLTQWQANQRVVLEPNPAFPEALGGPGLSRIVLRIIPEASTMFTELKTGGVHVDIALQPEQTREVKSDSNLQLFSFPGRTFYYIGWNNKREPFTRAAVRRAIALGINRQEIIDALLFGQGTIATSTVPSWHPLYPKDVQPLPYDPTQAQQLLEKEGWHDSDGDGIRDKNGKPLRFVMLSSTNALNRSVVEMLQAQLRRIGVDAQPRALEFQTMRAQHVARDFDAVFTNWKLDNFQMAATPNALFHSLFANQAGSNNRSSVSIPALDRLLDQVAATTDEAQARTLFAEMNEVLKQEQPVTFMYWFNELAAARKEVQGVTMDQRGEFVNVADWSIGRR
ncbi:MAG: ABC transporter substrate-binding protein [Longimicrobiales bacterium]